MLDPSFSLSDLGWDSAWEASFSALEDATELQPARVLVSHKELYDVHTGTDELIADLAGALRFAATSSADLPVTGDWIAVQRASQGRALVHHLLPRRSCFSRKAAGRTSAEQVVAANVDTIFLVTSLDADFSTRRLERYLINAWESGARPVIVLNKADICSDVAVLLAQAERIAIGVPIHVVSALDPAGLAPLRAEIHPGRTIALLGSSGVGKSTIVNALFGRAIQPTAAVRSSDAKGRHTTTSREIVLLPGGGLLLDTPGMRELHLWADADDLSDAFPDIAALASGCRFRDCTHLHEPGCTVRNHVDADRLESFHRLQREVQHLELRVDALAAQEQKKKWKAVHKAMRHHPKYRE